MKTNHQVTTGMRTFDEAGMASGEPGSASCIQDAARKEAMEAELNELRYHLERNVEQRTE